MTATHGGRRHRDVRLSRRRFLAAGLGALGVGIGAVVAIDEGVLPGESTLQRLGADPKCWFGGSCAVNGELVAGSFYSRFRRRVVGYEVGYPPGHSRGDRLPLVLSLHGFHGDHGSALAGFTAPEALALPGARLRPFALATIDGGGGYWHPHPGDDPMGMVVHEFIPMLRRWGLGVPPEEVAVMGLSMGGYGAIIFAENYPHLFRSVAAISPAIFVTYNWVHYVNPGAYWSAADFARYDAVTHTASLRSTPIRIASGQDDPFHPWVEQLAAELPPGAEVLFPPGGHDATFFRSQIEPSLRFISDNMAN